MHRKMFLIFGVVGLSLMATGSLPARANATDGGASEVTRAQLPTAVAKTLTQEAAGGQVEQIDITPGDNQAAYEANVVINKMPYEIKIALDGTRLEKHVDYLNSTMNQSSAPAQGTIKQVMRNGSASDIGEQLFYEIGVAVRWLSIITAVILLFIFCKACGVFSGKSLGGATGGRNIDNFSSNFPRTPVSEGEAGLPGNGYR